MDSKFEVRPSDAIWKLSHVQLAWIRHRYYKNNKEWMVELSVARITPLVKGADDFFKKRISAKYFSQKKRYMPFFFTCELLISSYSQLITHLRNAHYGYCQFLSPLVDDERVLSTLSFGPCLIRTRIPHDALLRDTLSRCRKWTVKTRAGRLSRGLIAAFAFHNPCYGIRKRPNCERSTDLMIPRKSRRYLTNILE